MGTLEGQHGGHAVLLGLREFCIGDQGIESAAHVAQRDARALQAQHEMLAARDHQRMLGLEILHVLPGPAVAGLAGVARELDRREGQQRGLQRGERIDGGHLVRGGRHGRSLQGLLQPHRRREDVLTHPGGGAIALRLRRAAVVEPDALCPESHHHLRGATLDDLNGLLLQVLAGPTHQATVGQRDVRLFVEAREQCAELIEHGAHEITFTSQCASFCGVRAAISMPQAASRSAIWRS
ncbi:MAG TPA: hypothetical protein PLX45_06515 [Piscinibacter sp.]|nr:hypothetical protein [Piscinibacter sp.]